LRHKTRLFNTALRQLAIVDALLGIALLAVTD
jgi:hypothetical protein